MAFVAPFDQDRSDPLLKELKLGLLGGGRFARS
jgi:hypothetical protein